MDNFYCSQKFTWLTVDLEKKLTQSCCQADLSVIDLTWLKQNSGRLFNTPLLLKERQLMLDNQPVSSCENACWRPERNNIVSRRMVEQSYKKTHLELESTPEILTIIFGSTCNLTCSYCCKTYSSAWGQDIVKNGAYLDHERFKMHAQDKILLKLSQNEVAGTNNFVFLLNEVSKFTNIPQVRITGGEPFLYNSLLSLLDQLSSCKQVIIHTGLGVNYDRFCRQLDKIQHIENLEISVSAENIGKFYEFNRYGNSFENFKKNLDEIQARNIKLAFNSVISNLTIFGLVDFVNEYSSSTIHYSLCQDPDFLSLNVLDQDSIDQLSNTIDQSNILIKDELIKSLQGGFTTTQKENLSTYLKEFARRRDLDLAIFPKSMLQWLSI